MRPYGGDEEDRTPDPLLAKQVLSQLSYTPIFRVSLFLSSFFLQALPSTFKIEQCFFYQPFSLADRSYELAFILLRKEVIQPHLPIRLPCYDLTLIINPTFGGVLLAVRLPTSGPPGSHGVTGGVYKARERIHRGMLIHDY